MYGLNSLREWELRLAAHDREGLRNLRGTRRTAGRESLSTARVVTSFEELISVVSFLTVMNKDMRLLFRGQRRDDPLLPSLLREKWRPPDTPWERATPISSRRDHYWTCLTDVEDMAMRVLRRHGLPRWRHMESYRYARWAVIQHYELWPTPMLDWTTSLRVAASFACLHAQQFDSAFLYVTGTRRLNSDLMTLGSDDSAESDDGALTVRLDAVCPPSAIRPHFQEGALSCLYPFDGSRGLEPDDHDFLPLVIARIELAGSDNFWTTDFPVHSKAALLPPETSDALLRDFRRNIVVDDADGVLVPRWAGST